ncbi:ciliary rootlet coiled-coil protein 2-like [Haliotis asinina]|uniref:ciliary rootlet coiled-coil protein 2-like n=1 Tax=Haliotis asinina TaxID=109174 RepID=UPI003531DA63
MGVEDVSAVFDRLDTCKLGYVTADQLLNLQHTLSFSPVSLQLVNTAIQHICGQDGVVTRGSFVGVLEEIERLQAIQEQAYWDFQALDYNGDHRITLKDALMLFKEFHGESFSMQTWHDFLSSRTEPNADVFFDELFSWLCVKSSGEICSQEQMAAENARLAETKLDFLEHQYHTLSQFKKEDSSHSDEIKLCANRKLNKWNQYGIESVLFDDGLHVGLDHEVKVRRSRESVGMVEIFTALDNKYNLLQDKLLLGMARYSAAVDSEISDMYKHLKHEILALKGGNLEVADMTGSRAWLAGSVASFMGEVGAPLEMQYKEQEAQVLQLKGEGKSDQFIKDAIKSFYHNSLAGPTTCGEAIQELFERQRTEKDAIIKQVQGVSSAMFVKYASLSRQYFILTEESEFSTASVAVGLAERIPGHSYPGFNWDRTRSESLAKERLEQRSGHRPMRTSGVVTEVDSTDTNRLDMQIQVVRELERKQYLEREALIHMLQGQEIQAAVNGAMKISATERKRRANMLRNQHFTWRESVQSDSHSTAHADMLQEGVGLYWAEREAKLQQAITNPTDREIAATILADLQHSQEIEFQIKLSDLHNKTVKELCHMVRRESRSQVQEHFDNIAYVVLGAVEIGEIEKEYIDALQEKYTVLRDAVLLFSLKDQYGSEWNRFSNDRQHKELQRAQKEEKALRGEGKLEEMHRIMGPKSQTLPSLQTLMGSPRQFSDEAETPVPTINLLADLVSRYDRDQDNLLRWLKSPASKNLTAANRRLHLLYLHLETLCAKMETDYEAVLMATGLLERVCSGDRCETDQERQHDLAERRVHLRKEHVQKGQVRLGIVDRSSTPRGDLCVWREAYMQEVYHRHCEERERLLSLLQDESLRELTEVAANMPRSERVERLAQLRVKKTKLDLQNADDLQDEYTDLLEESAVLQTVCRTETLTMTHGQSVLPHQVTAAILVSLQVLQDTEMAELLLTLPYKCEVEELTRLWHGESDIRQHKTTWNVYNVLTAYEGAADDKCVLEMLDAKYSVLREQLLLSAIDGGTTTSAHHTDLQFLKAKEQALWKKGDVAGLDQLLTLTLSEGLSGLMGLDRQQFHNKISSIGAEAGSVVMIDEDLCSTSTVSDLLTRYTHERMHIISVLQGKTGECMTLPTRITLLARLYRELNIVLDIGQSGAFEAAAISVGLAERQDKCQYRLRNERNRYISFASHVWNSVCDKSSRPSDKQPYIARISSLTQEQKSIVGSLEQYHGVEQKVFLSMLRNKVETDEEMTASLSTQQQQADLLASLRAQFSSLSKDDMPGHLRILQQATVIKRECRRAQLPKDNQTDDSASISLMADLLLHQNKDAESHLTTIGSLSPEEHLQMLTEIKGLEDGRRCANIAAVVFALDRDHRLTDQDVIQAVEEKYDALNDKLLMEALISEMGEADWLRLSEKERQRKLMELKLKQRQLKKQGLLDEAAALLGDLQKDRETLRCLMGESRDEQERRMRERLEKRKQRLAEGLSTEECDRLEQEDVQREETEDRNRNILQQMEQRIEEEKASLLKQLVQSGDEMEKERERQAALARLRLEQRRVRQEENFDSAALMLGLVEEQGEKVQSQKSEERARQERLAHDRLEAARRRLKTKDSVQHVDDVDVDADTVMDNDLMMKLMEAVDKKHQAERAVLIQCADDKSGGGKTQASMSTEDLKERLDVLQGFREGWRKSQIKPPQEQTVIFQEAISCVIELKNRQDEQEEEGASCDHVITLLADLQQHQGHDMNHILARVQKQEPSLIREELKVAVEAVTKCYHDNVAAVLFLMLYNQNSSSDELLQELDHKYDALRDKLVIEALLKQYGHVQWSHMTEQERQTHIIQKRLEERRLRRAGKIDEVNLLLGKYLEEKKGLEEMLSESQDVQRRRMEARMERRRQVREERQNKGMVTDEELLDRIFEEEEEKSSEKKNIFETLEVQYEEERAALLAQLGAQEDQMQKERKKQAVIAKLRRDQKLLQKEENLDSACLVFSIGQQAMSDHENSFTRERERQKQLAQDRLNALRKQGKGKVLEEDLEGLTEMLENQKLTNRFETGVEHQLLGDMDERHREEREVLVQLLQAASTDTPSQKSAEKHKIVQELKKQLASLQQEHSKWLNKSRQAVLSEGQSTPLDTAKRRFEQFQVLKKALIYRLEVERRLAQDKPSDDQLDVQLLTDLQQKQTRDAQVIASLMTNKDEDVLEKLVKMQGFARREGWYDNLTAVLFTVSDDHQVDPTEDSANIPVISEIERQMEREFDREKGEALEAALVEGQNVDTAAILQQLEADQAMRKQAILEQHARQRKEMEQKLSARREASTNREFEAATAVQLLKMAENQSQAVSDQVHLEKDRQGSLLQEKLAARRQSRKRLASVDEEPKQDTAIIPSLVRSGSLKREKSTVGVEVSEDDRQAKTRQLVREQENVKKKLVEQQERQEQMVKHRLEQKRGKLKNEAAELFSLGERQKTILEKSQKDERDRQLSLMVERKNRVMYERTRTQRSTTSPDSGGFENIVKNEGLNLTIDEKMELAAQQLQEKFQREAEAHVASGSVLLGEEARFEQLKARRQQRRKKGSDQAQ